jgi:hypothetical protein
MLTSPESAAPAFLACGTGHRLCAMRHLIACSMGQSATPRPVRSGVVSLRDKMVALGVVGFTMPYATGFAWLASEMQQLRSNLASIGIKLSLKPEPFDENPTNDALIAKTLSSSRLQYLYNWQDYLSKQLPVLWQPSTDYQLTEITGDLKGVMPQSPTLSLTPEYWYFTQ